MKRSPRRAAPAKESNSTYVFVAYYEDSTGGEHVSDELFADREDTHIDVTFEYLSVRQPHTYHCRSVEVDKALLDESELYLAVVRYSDGDTFGRTYGCWEILGVRGTRAEADKLIEDARKSKTGSWTGYFARFDHGEVHCLHLEK